MICVLPSLGVAKVRVIGAKQKKSALWGGDWCCTRHRCLNKGRGYQISIAGLFGQEKHVLGGKFHTIYLHEVFVTS